MEYPQLTDTSVPGPLPTFGKQRAGLALLFRLWSATQKSCERFSRPVVRLLGFGARSHLTLVSASPPFPETLLKREPGGERGEEGEAGRFSGRLPTAGSDTVPGIRDLSGSTSISSASSRGEAVGAAGWPVGREEKDISGCFTVAGIEPPFAEKYFPPALRDQGNARSAPQLVLCRTPQICAQRTVRLRASRPLHVKKV